MKKRLLFDLTLVTAAIFAAAFVADLGLVLTSNDRYSLDELRLLAAERQGVPFDRRSKFDVVMDLRSAGNEAYPLDYPQEFLLDTAYKVQMVGGKPFFPFSSISHALIVNCNEGGTYASFKSDRYGFNNDDHVYDRPGDALIIGDSFAHGSCVPPEKNVAAQLAKQGVRVIDMGVGGNGPLIDLATLREYGRAVHPRKIFWLHYQGNDLLDIKKEMPHPLLARYLQDAHFSLGMAERQPQVDAYWKQRAETLISKRKGERDAPLSTDIHWKDVFALKLVQEKAWLGLRGVIAATPLAKRLLTPDESVDEIIPLIPVLKEAQRFSRQELGAELYFVYLPSQWEFAKYSGNRDALLAQVKSLGIPVIDFRPTLVGTGDPLAYFPFRQIGHYTPEGYALLAGQLYREGWPAGPVSARP